MNYVLQPVLTRETLKSAVWAQQLSCVRLVRGRVCPSMLSPVFLIREKNSDPAHRSISGWSPDPYPRGLRRARTPWSTQWHWCLEETIVMTPRAVPKKKKRPSAEMLAGAHRSHVSDSRYSRAFPTCNDSYLEVFVLCFFPSSECGWEPKVTSWCYGVRGHGPLPGSALLTLWTSPQHRDRPLTSCPASPSWKQLLCAPHLPVLWSDAFFFFKSEQWTRCSVWTTRTSHTPHNLYRNKCTDNQRERRGAVETGRVCVHPLTEVVERRAESLSRELRRTTR